MKTRQVPVVIIACLSLLWASAALAKNPPKTTKGLMTKHANVWHAATHNTFLDKVKDGTLPFKAFATWLGQDYHFASNLLDSQCLILLHAPRADQNLLIGGLFASDSELSWLEANASTYNIDLNQAVLPTCRMYNDFLLALQYQPYAVQVTSVWALNKAYYDAWSTALPGAPKYKEFVDRWTTPAFKDYVDGLKNAVNRVLASASKEDRALAEVYFLWIALYEKDFWDMVLNGK
jgi:formylaminopyrimidine deformylase / aminopyrimidine aminohydrolase